MQNGWTCLVWAAYKGHAEIVEFLINMDAKVDVTVNVSEYKDK